ELIAFDSGDDTPPAWVPADVATYTSIHWNLDQTYEKGTKLGDSFWGQGATAKMIHGRADRMLGLDFESDILPAATGRFITLGWFQRPAKVGVGAQNAFGIQVRDSKQFEPTVEKLVSHFGERLERKSCSGITYYKAAAQREPDDPRPTPCFALLDD